VQATFEGAAITDRSLCMTCPSVEIARASLGGGVVGTPGCVVVVVGFAGAGAATSSSFAERPNQEPDQRPDAEHDGGPHEHHPTIHGPKSGQRPARQRPRS